MELDHDATLALAVGPMDRRRLQKAYALLHESGSLMEDESGPIVGSTWGEISHLARVNSAAWILAIEDKRVIRVAQGKVGVYVVQERVLLTLNKEALESITAHDHTHQEIAREEAASKARKRPSGAENRRRRRV
jgi:hypothetical protein